MRLETNGLDVTIKNFIKDECPSITLENEGEEIKIEFGMDRQGFDHTAEQFISALFNYNEDLAHKLYQEFGNVEDLKDEIVELKEELKETKNLLYQAER